MHAVADGLAIGFLARHRSANDARLAMRELGHAVERVDEDGAACSHTRCRLVEGGGAVSERHRDPAVLAASAVFGHARTLWCQCALADEALGLLLPSIKPIEVGIAKVFGVLGALVLLGEERALEEDALDAGTFLIARRLGDARAGAARLLEGGGERGGNPACGAVTGELARDLAHAPCIAIHHVMA